MEGVLIVLAVVIAANIAFVALRWRAVRNRPDEPLTETELRDFAEFCQRHERRRKRRERIGR